MKKYILLSLVIFFTIYSAAMCDDKIYIPDGVWQGNLNIRGGSVICNFTINKILIKNNIVNIYGDHVLGTDSFSFEFDLLTDKWAWSLFKINTLEFFYDFSFLDKNKIIKLSFNDRCKAEGLFKLKN
ncbi:hypothetical protein OAC06_08145 [Alphaproteobacteria bacterium]|nr:hypothetical protein [Alphaproteobacteria bacterium]